MNLRNCFDRAARGEPVTIERGGLTFYLTVKPLYTAEKSIDGIGEIKQFTEEPKKNLSGLPNSCNCNDFPVPHSHLSDDGTSHNIRPDIKNTSGATPQTQEPVIPARIKNLDTPVRTQEEWQEAEGLEKDCCKLQKPCQHWQYNESTAIWQNTLSGRQREVEI